MLSTNGSASTVVLDDHDRTFEEKVSTATLCTRGGIQDAICELLTRPWSLAVDGSMAFADVRVDEGFAHLWFGDESSPVVTFPPIDRSEIEKAT